MGTTESTSRVYGIDVDTAISADQWSCLTDAGCKFTVVRCYRNAHGGEPDTSCPATVAAAWAAGLEFVDVYLFPVIRDKTAQAQARECLTFLSDNNVKYGRLWLDVEGETTGTTWYPDTATNVTFIQDFVTEVQEAGVTVGIYCGTEGWNEITGGSTAFAALPLWWSSHGKSYVSFGGWSGPTLVQYAYNTETCKATYDSDYVE